MVCCKVIFVKFLVALMRCVRATSVICAAFPIPASKVVMSWRLHVVDRMGLIVVVIELV